MIEHVWRRCQESGAFNEVLVATDDTRIHEAMARLASPGVNFAVALQEEA